MKKWGVSENMAFPDADDIHIFNFGYVIIDGIIDLAVVGEIIVK